MAWIESHTVLIRHRKLREVARSLGLRPSHMMCHLHALWHAALEKQEDGDLSSWSDAFIADQADYPGDAEAFISTLVHHRWLEENRLIHDWLDYAGHWLRRKYSSGNRSKLEDIWARHGRTYAEATRKRHGSDTEATPTNQPNQPTYPPTHARGGERELSEKTRRIAEELKQARRQQ